MKMDQRLPMPVRLDPPKSVRSLGYSVRTYFYALYNGASDAFRERLVAVGNKDALTGNMLFDRYEAVDLIRAAARKAEDPIVVNAKHGDIYRIVVRLLRGLGQGLKLRRQEHKLLTHQAPAE